MRFFATTRSACTYVTQKSTVLARAMISINLLWQLSHENIQAYKDRDGWFLLVNNACHHVQKMAAGDLFSDAVCRDHPMIIANNDAGEMALSCS